MMIRLGHFNLLSSEKEIEILGTEIDKITSFDTLNFGDV